MTSLNEKMKHQINVNVKKNTQLTNLLDVSKAAQIKNRHTINNKSQQIPVKK